MSELTTTIESLECQNALLQRKLKSLRNKIRLYQQVSHVCGPAVASRHASRKGKAKNCDK